MKALKFAITLGAILSALTAHADITPTPITGDARLVEFDYNPESIYLVLTRPLAHTNIVFPMGEKIRLIKAGDTYSFMIEADKGLNEIFIKPKFEGIETTMTVATTSKRYQFVLRSTGKNRKYYQQVNFTAEQHTLFEFGEEAAANINAPSEALGGRSVTERVEHFNPADLNMNYTISGDAKFKPETVYDNGKFMYIKFPKNLTELPAIFAKDSKGIYLVNYVPDQGGNNVIIVQQMVEELLLKIDNNQIDIRRGKKGIFGWSSN